MNYDGEINAPGEEVINPDGSVIPTIESENISREKEKYVISKEDIPKFNKILVTDDGKDISNKALNYAISLSNSTNAEMVILRIIEDVDQLDISVEGSKDVKENNKLDNENFERTIKGEIINSMEEKIKNCRMVGCNNKVSYKFLTGNAIDEIVKEINDNSYDLVVLTTSHIDSWFRSLFSDARKIISNISKPVLIIQ
ncbi:MAG TPA: universal stress protein [Nitrososphaeraceae archaeon]|nr:universal stress protein [Nitrososphaeraceae archaeon]